MRRPALHNAPQLAVGRERDEEADDGGGDGKHGQNGHGVVAGGHVDVGAPKWGRERGEWSGVAGQ